MLCHAQDRRNADSSGHQHDARRRRIKREMVPRLAGRDESAGHDGIDQGGATTARGGLAQDPDQIAMLLARIVAERVLAHQARNNLDVDMRTRTELRQRFTCRIDELEARDVIGFLRLCRHLERFPKSGHDRFCVLCERELRGRVVGQRR
jgi:hypothetical protein